MGRPDRAGAPAGARCRPAGSGRRCYVSLQEAASALQRLEEARALLPRGMAFCDERELRCAHALHAGRPSGHVAAARALGRGGGICTEMLAIPGVSPVEPALPAADPRHDPRPPRRTRLRRSCWTPRRALAEGIVSPVWVAQVRAVRAELLWVSGQADLALPGGTGGLRAGSRPGRSVEARVAGDLAVAARAPGWTCRPACRNRTRWRSPATGRAAPPPGSGSAGPTTPP